jgi:hypothetical protein
MLPIITAVRITAELIAALALAAGALQQMAAGDFQGAGLFFIAAILIIK